MLEKLSGIEKRYEELNRLLIEVGDNYQRAAELNKERLDLEPIFEKSKEYRRDMVRVFTKRALRKAIYGNVSEKEGGHYDADHNG